MMISFTDVQQHDVIFSKQQHDDVVISHLQDDDVISRSKATSASQLQTMNIAQLVHL